MKALFLDRDGVINRAIVRDGKPHAPRTLRDFRLLPGVRESIARARDAGWFVGVVTNQPDIGNGLVSRETVNAMHRKIRGLVDAIAVCPHRQDANCSCRKPKPGMILALAARHDLDTSISVMIGDRAQDVLAGKAAGCYTILVNRMYREPVIEPPDLVVGSLPEAIDILLRPHALRR